MKKNRMGVTEHSFFRRGAIRPDEAPGGKRQHPGLSQERWRQKPERFIPRNRAQHPLDSGVDQSQKAIIVRRAKQSSQGIHKASRQG